MYRTFYLARMIVTVETTQKGFKVIPLTWKQALHLGGRAICDGCNEIPQTGTYIPVLNSYYCPACYAAWHEPATFHPENQEPEQKIIDIIVDMLKSA